jgi:hypothetical protein
MMSTRREKGERQKGVLSLPSASPSSRESLTSWGLSASRERRRVHAGRDQSPSSQSSYGTISTLVLRRTVWRRGTHLVSVLLGKTIYCVFPDACTVHMFHHQNPIRTSFPHPRDFEACVGAEPLQASERAHTCRLARIIAFVHQFLFHDLSHLSLIHRQLHPFAVKNNGAGSTASVLLRNSPRGSSRPAVRSMRM